MKTINLRKPNRLKEELASILLLFLFLIINTFIQITFKTLALSSGGSSYAALLLEPLFYVCGLLFAAMAVVWLAVLRRMPLSRAYPFTSLTVITLLLSGAFFFEEGITLGNVLGALVIMVGITVIAGGQNDIDTEPLSGS